MTTFLTWLLILELFAMIAWGFIRREQILQYPFLAAIGFAGYLLPQFISLSQGSYAYTGGINKTFIMAILCLLAAHLGYVLNKRPATLFRCWQFKRRSLVIASAIFTAIGAFFFYKVGMMSAEESLKHGGAWTGIITIYVFFGQLLTIGMVIALVVHLNRPSWSTFIIVFVGAMFFLDRIVMQGRRSAAIELSIIVILSLWFNRRWLPPRSVVVSAIIIGILVVNSIGDYRSTMLENDRTTWTGAGLSEVLEVDYWENFKQSFTKEGFDVINAVHIIDVVDHSLRLDYWLSIYNAIITNYIPGQFVGYKFKQSLKIDIGSEDYGRLGFTPKLGSTSTGLADAFRSFWYFGAIKFFLIGLILSRWYKAALTGNIVAQLIVILVSFSALLAFPFDTDKFFLKFLNLAVFLLPALILARTTRKPVRSSHQSLVAPIH